jgi:hypothetical protein
MSRWPGPFKNAMYNLWQTQIAQITNQIYKLKVWVDETYWQKVVDFALNIS